MDEAFFFEDHALRIRTPISIPKYNGDKERRKLFASFMYIITIEYFASIVYNKDENMKYGYRKEGWTWQAYFK